MGPGARSSRTRAALLAMALAAALALPGVGAIDPGLSGSSPHSPIRISTGAPTAALNQGPLVAVTPPTFWSLDLQTNNSSGVWSDATVRAFLNATPFTWVRYGELTEECNISADRLYASNGTVVPGGCLYNLTAFKDWCWSRTPHCHAVLPLPGENNNSAEDASIARWIVQTIGFQPDYWSVGNEPSGWKHYGIPWTQWSPQDNSTPTPLAYAFDLKAAITAVRGVDPSAKFMGIEAACACQKPAWFQDIVRVDGARISALGYHSYPWGGSYNETLDQFYGALSSVNNISTTYAHMRAEITGRCARCSTLPIYLHEYNAGPGNGHTNFSGGYANAVFLAASVTQALRANVTQFTVFNLQSNLSAFGYAMINRTDVVGPTGILFSNVLDHLVRGSVYATGFSPGFPGLWSVLTVGPGSGTLLVINTNLTQTLTFSPSGVFSASKHVSSIAWHPGARFPAVTNATLQPSYSVGPQGILLLSVPARAVHGPARVGAAGAPTSVQRTGAAPVLPWESGVGPVLGGVVSAVLLRRAPVGLAGNVMRGTAGARPP
ncbi:MAG TPA: hypothetical protein VGV89_04490 [Thermoplasmata archaeon]|nr:hypothetical protein [Thermoplasmata archaeon]